MTERTKVSHLRNYVVGHITKDTLLRLVPTADLAWIKNNKEKIIKLYDNYQSRLYEEAKDIFL